MADYEKIKDAIDNKRPIPKDVINGNPSTAPSYIHESDDISKYQNNKK